MILQDIDQAVEEIIRRKGNDIILGTPLGAGKANPLINALYRRVKRDKSLRLTILTALTLQIPQAKSDLERRFLCPFTERVFGNYPDLEYEIDRVQDKLPSHIRVIEFYYPPGKYLNLERAQQDYLSTNYTHAIRDIMARGMNVLCQQVCKGEIAGQKVLSLSCNPDLTVDLALEMRKSGRPLLLVGQVNQDLPFMYGESVVGEDFFDLLLDNRQYDFKVFGPPKFAVKDAEYMIGLHASTLLKDDGEIQIGIGSLGDALAYGLCLRQNQQEQYRSLLDELQINEQRFPLMAEVGELGTFEVGLFAATEMFVDCFASLYRNNILKKRVYDSVVIQRLLNQGKIKEEFDGDILNVLLEEKAIHSLLTEDDMQFLQEFGILRPEVKWDKGQLLLESGERISPDLRNSDSRQAIQERALGRRLRNGAVAHAGFFLGQQSFYQFLKDLPVEERKLIRMKRISKINHLYGHEEIDRLQRRNGRFFNNCMKVTLNGSICSDTLEDGRQVSGVGGQYNFVAMAHELPDARSILQLSSTRMNQDNELESNIVFSYAGCTIPRHLRDIVITEYGMADLRSRTDEEVAIALIKIADSRFQQELLQKAKEAKKIRKDYQLPEEFRKNLPEKYRDTLRKFKELGLFPDFPFGMDFTDEEVRIGKALKYLKGKSRKWSQMLPFVLSALLSSPKDRLRADYRPLLARMELEAPKTAKEWFYQLLLLRGLKETS